MFDAVGVSPDDTRKPRLQRGKSFVCEVCYDDSADETLALSCGHRFCKSCYAHYVSSKIHEGESRNIQCMAGKCRKVVDEATVEQLVGPDLLARYRTLLNRTFVDDNPALRFCPAPNCEYAVECHVSKKSLDTIVPSVTCSCSYRCVPPID